MDRETRLAALEARVLKLENTRHRSAPPVEQQQQVIITPTRDVNMHFIPPSDEELVALHKLARSLHPRVVARDQSFELAHMGFGAAFTWLANVGRVATINNRRSLIEWCQDGYAWHRSNGSSGHFTGPDFALACVAHDIPVDLTAYPSIGVCLPQHGGGEMPNGTGWKQLLEKHRVPA